MNKISKVDNSKISEINHDIIISDIEYSQDV